MTNDLTAPGSGQASDSVDKDGEAATAAKKTAARKSSKTTTPSAKKTAAKADPKKSTAAAPAEQDERAPAARQEEPPKAKKTTRRAPARKSVKKETEPEQPVKAADAEVKPEAAPAPKTADKKASGSTRRKTAPKKVAPATEDKPAPKAKPAPQADAAKQADKPAPKTAARSSARRAASPAKAAKPETAESSALQVTTERLPEVKAESMPALLEENYPAVHTENLPALSEQGEPSEASPAKKSRRSRGRTQKNRTTAENGQQPAEKAEAQEAIPLEEAQDAAAPDTQPKPDKKADATPAKAAAKPAPKAKRKMFVNVLAGEQVEVVIAEDGQVNEYYVEMLHQAKVKGNIYKGVIHNVDPNLQAAFVSYGAAKNGFLQIDEVHPEYYLAPHEQGRGHKYPLMQKVLKAGQEILVQVVKEPSGTKGAFLTSYLSLPGRYLVLTPGREQIGVSRKVGNDAERSRLREILSSLKPGEGLGVIVRTVSEGASKTNLQRDLRFLKRQWQDVRKRGSIEEAPSLIYQELGLAARAVRDYLTEDITELWVNDEEMAAQMQEVIELLFPKRAGILQMHKDSAQSLFDRFGLSKQIHQVQSREVVLPSGGRLVFDHTEALTAIDINSGRSGGKSNFEDMAFKINLEAARHIPLQLRLRDIGGQVVVDFIEMRDRNHWREVEKTFRAGMKGDRARHDVGKISSFGLLEVVRQRLGSSAISIASEPCPFCNGTGMRRNMEWQAMQALQEIQNLLRQSHEPGKTLVYEASGELILYLLNKKKERLLEMESDSGVKLELRPGL